MFPQVFDQGLLEESYAHLAMILSKNLHHQSPVVSEIQKFQILTNGAGENHSEKLRYVRNI